MPGPEAQLSRVERRRLERDGIAILADYADDEREHLSEPAADLTPDEARRHELDALRYGLAARRLRQLLGQARYRDAGTDAPPRRDGPPDAQPDAHGAEPAP